MTTSDKDATLSFWLFNLYAQASEHVGDILANAQAPRNIASFERQPPVQATFEDVISPESLDEAYAVMVDTEQRICNMNIAMQVAALNAGNPDLAEKIAQRWMEFSQEMEKNPVFSNSESFVSGGRDAVKAYESVMSDMMGLANQDPQTRGQITNNPEIMTEFLRGRAGVFHGARQMNSLFDAVEKDLESAGLVREAALQEDLGPLASPRLFS